MMKDIYKEISREELKNYEYKNIIQASHCMIYAINKGKIKLDDDKYDAKANILVSKIVLLLQ